MAYSERAAPNKAALLEVLDIAEAEEHAGADSEEPRRIRLLALDQTVYGFRVPVPPPDGQLFTGEDLTGCFLAALRWIRAGIVH